jgi:hypothetical protein
LLTIDRLGVVVVVVVVVVLCDWPCRSPQVPDFKLKVKSGITMVADGGVKVRVELDKDYATMKA